MRAADSRIFCTAGSNSPMSMPMIAMTTSSSTSVKPRRNEVFMTNSRRNTLYYAHYTMYYNPMACHVKHKRIKLARRWLVIGDRWLVKNAGSFTNHQLPIANHLPNLVSDWAFARLNAIVE